MTHPTGTNARTRVVRRLPKAPTLLIVSALCIGQFVWTIIDQQVTGWPLVFAVSGLAVTSALFLAAPHLGHRFGARREITSPTE